MLSDDGDTGILFGVDLHFFSDNKSHRKKNLHVNNRPAPAPFPQENCIKERSEQGAKNL